MPTTSECPARGTVAIDRTEMETAMYDGRYSRVPGAFRRWELPEVLKAGHDYRLEEAGRCEDGTLLYAVYLRRFEAMEHG